MEELDSTDCDIEMDVWEDMDCPVLISGLCVDNSLCLSGQAMSSYRDVAYMGDFADEDFIDTGTRGMMHTHGNLGARLQISRRTQLELFWRSQ